MKKAKKTIGMLVAVEIGAVLSRYGDKLTDVSETGFDVKRLDSDDYTMYILKSGAVSYTHLTLPTTSRV